VTDIWNMTATSFFVYTQRKLTVIIIHIALPELGAFSQRMPFRDVKLGLM